MAVEIRLQWHTCQPCHFILLDTLFIFAGHQEKLQDTNTISIHKIMTVRVRACARAWVRLRFPRDAVAACRELEELCMKQ